MFTFENREAQLDELLDKMAEEVQLDITRYERMKSSYESIQAWLEDDELFFKPFSYDVYPHGSVRILTTVKPIGKDEFDLDIAIHLKSNTPHTPHRIYNELKRRLGENELYRKKIELKNRCIRLNYAGDFHIDILTGVQENTFDKNRLKVPDQKLSDWVSSNPRGYAEWFFERVNLVSESLLEKALKAEKLPNDNFKNKKPLQRGVQLIKRYRDIYFQEDGTFKTSSIILTTIAGNFYKGEESIFDTVDGIISTIREQIVLYPYTRLKVLNPVNDAEDFTDKWDKEPQYYEAFKKFVFHLYNEWQKLKEQYGLIEEGKIMKGLFGDDLFMRAQTKQASEIDNLRQNNLLSISRASGILSPKATNNTIIKSNTFYGE